MAEKSQEIQDYLEQVAELINNAPKELPGIILFPKFNNTERSCVYVNGTTEILKGILVQLMKQSEDMKNLIADAFEDLES